MTDVLEIVRDWLDVNGYDGLCYPDECACLKGDLAPCGEINGACKPGYRVDGCSDDCVIGECSWHIETKPGIAKQK